MTRLRKMMLEELQRRNYSDDTIRHHLRAVTEFAEHFGKPPDKLGLYQSNARVPARLIRRQRALDETGELTLELAIGRLSLSAGAHDRILKVARTVADLDGAKGVAATHVAKAMQYRSLDRNYRN